MLGNTYLLRSVNYDRSDVLISFRVVRRDSDGSLILLWKMLRQFPGPILVRNSSDAFPAASSAKHPIGKVKGMILDVNKARVVNAIVELQGVRKNCKAISSEEGEFELKLPAGSYQVTVEAEGFRRFSLGPIEVKPDETKMLDIHLEVAEPPGLVPAFLILRR